MAICYTQSKFGSEQYVRREGKKNGLLGGTCSVGNGEMTLSVKYFEEMEKQGEISGDE